MQEPRVGCTETREGSGSGAAMRREIPTTKPSRKRRLPSRFFWFSWLEIFTAIRLDFYWKAIWTLLLCFSVFTNSIFCLPQTVNKLCVFQQSRQREVCGSIACVFQMITWLICLAGELTTSDQPFLNKLHHVDNDFLSLCVSLSFRLDPDETSITNPITLTPKIILTN